MQTNQNTTTRKSGFRARLLATPEVVTALATATAAQTAFMEALQPLLPLLHPDREKQTLTALIRDETDPAIIAAAVAKMNELSGEGARAAQARAKVLSQQLLSTFQRPVLALLVAAEAAADDLIADAVQAEQDLFDQFKIEAEPTSISEAAKSLKRQIKALHASDSSGAHVRSFGLAAVRPDINANVLSFFKS